MVFELVPDLVRTNQMLQNTEFSNGGGGHIIGESSNDKFLISNGDARHSEQSEESKSDRSFRIRQDDKENVPQDDITLDNIISVENLLLAWQEFVKGKRHKRDVQEFSWRLMDNILTLHTDLANQKYQHGGYYHFKISDPKPRDIHKANVRDRLVHHALYRILYPYFDRTFIADSYSCRLGKGTHKALNRFRDFAYKVSRNHTRTCWVLKCDIRKFFANIDHDILLELLSKRIVDKNIFSLLENIISSFTTHSTCIPRNTSAVGLPLGNLTSQLLVNIYMDECDQYAKHILKAKYYIRYADDFVLFSDDRSKLENLIPQIRDFLKTRLYLELHPDKLFLRTVASGVDFLGWVHFQDHRVLRTASRNRMARRLREHPSEGTIGSYQGLLSHGNTYRLKEKYLSFPDIVSN